MENKIEILESKESLGEKLSDKLKKAKGAMLALALLATGETHRAMNPIVEHTSYGTGGEKVAKVAETGITAMWATPFQAIEDIRTMLHEAGISEDKADPETTRKITLKKDATLMDLAQERIFELYTMGLEDESREFGPFRTMQAKMFAEHLCRINNLEGGIEKVIPSGTQIILDDDVFVPSNIQNQRKPGFIDNPYIKP